MGSEAGREAAAIYERAYAQVATLVLKAKGTDDDLVQMKHVSEDDIADMLCMRFERDLIYVSLVLRIPLLLLPHLPSFELRELRRRTSGRLWWQ
jgi:hypothetical protein